MGKVVIVGSSNTDMVVKSRRLPKPGETVMGGDFIMAAGGKGANQAVAARRAGSDVTLIAAVGDDMFGRRSVEGFRAEGMDVSHVATLEGVASGIALILLDEKGENTITVAPGANMKLSPSDVDAAADVIRAADVVMVVLEIPMETVERALKVAHDAKVRVLLNPAPAPQGPLPRDLLSKVFVLTPNEAEFKALTGLQANEDDDWAAARKLASEGPGAVVITLGSRGAVLATRDRAAHVPPYRIKPVDTVGAGDAFNGAFATALAEGRSLEEAARFASAAGALATLKLGAQPSMPWRDEIEKLLSSQ